MQPVKSGWSPSDSAERFAACGSSPMIRFVTTSVEQPELRQLRPNLYSLHRNSQSLSRSRERVIREQMLVNDHALRQGYGMRTPVRVSRRGTFTVPLAMRRRLGLNRPNSIVVVEEREAGLFLRPSVAVSVRSLTKKQIERWISRDKAEMAAFRTTRRSRESRPRES